MKNRLRTITKKVAASALTLTVVFGLVSGIADRASAHEGMEHITGTVVSVGEKALSVKTTKGTTIEVHLDAKTEYARGKERAKLSEIEPGTRVVVHAMKMNGALVAHQVSIGLMKPATTSAKKAQK